MRVGQMVVFLAVLSLLIGGLHYLLWARLFRDPRWVAPWPRVGMIALWALGLAMPLTMMLMRSLPRVALAPLAWIVFVWMGAAFGFFLLTLVGELARAVALASGALADPERRQWFSRAVAVAVGAGGVAFTVAAVRTALDRVAVRTVRVPLAKLPPSMDGYSIVQLTDVHVGPTIGGAFVAELVARVNALRPDVIVITGDLVDGSVAELGAHTAALANLRARHGVFFVTGNHEYYSGADEWIAELGRLGVRTLRNERVTLGDEAASIDLAGVDDWSARRHGQGHGADLARALAGRDEGRELVLLAHQPKAVDGAAERGVGLVLSGHTHGGQLWPFSYVVKLDQKYIAGLHRVGQTWAYVSEGTGYWGPPMRLGTHGEITKVVLTRGAAEQRVG